jgi:hypothetical protein
VLASELLPVSERAVVPFVSPLRQCTGRNRGVPADLPADSAISPQCPRAEPDERMLPSVFVQVEATYDLGA